jgi:hypothetical protein
MLHDHMIKQTNGNIQRIVSELNISIKKNKHDFDKQTYTRTLHSNVACMMWLNKQKKSRGCMIDNNAKAQLNKHVKNYCLNCCLKV